MLIKLNNIFRKVFFTIITLFIFFIIKQNHFVYADAADAALINVNQRYSGELTSFDDTDYYKVILEEDGNVTLSIKQKSDTTWYGSIENSNGDVYEDIKTDSSGMVSEDAVTQVGLPKGTYYIKINNYYNADGIPYEFSVNFTKSSTYEKEMNNDVTSANDIQTYQTYIGSINNYNDMDFYKFTIPKDGNVSLAIKNKLESRWEGHIQDSQGNIYEELSTDNSGSVDGNTTTEVGLPQGTYYIKVDYYYSAENIPYEMSVGYTESNNYEKENNNNVTAANTINLNQLYNGRINKYNDKDFYTFTLPSDGNVALSLKNMPGSSWTATIQNSKGETYQNLNSDDSELVKGNSVVNTGLAKGTYYIRVEGDYHSEDKTYDLKAKFTKSNNYEKEFNNSLSAANKMKLNQKYYGSENDYEDKDIYKFTLPSDGKVTIKMKQKAGIKWDANIQNRSGHTYSTLTTDDREIVSGYATSNKKMKKGTYYLVVNNYNYNAVNVPYEVSVSLKSNPLKTSQIKAANNKGKKDKITVKSLSKGDTVKVYNASKKGTVLATKKASGSSVNLSIKQLGKKAGKVYVTVTRSGMTESSRTAVSYKAEK